MFSKTNTPKPSTPEVATRRLPVKTGGSVPSILGPDIFITGDIKSDGDIQIDGRHDGNIVASKLTIGEQGSVVGTVKAKWVHVRGKISGKITANVVELAATANVQADIIQDQLTISNGAFFDGKCTRLSKTAATNTLTPAAASPMDTKPAPKAKSSA